MPSNTAISVSMWSIRLYPSDRHPGLAVAAAQAADQELPLIPRQPAVHVRASKSPGRDARILFR